MRQVGFEDVGCPYPLNLQDENLSFQWKVNGFDKTNSFVPHTGSLRGPPWMIIGSTSVWLPLSDLIRTS